MMKLIASSLLVFAACTDDAQSYSDPVAIELKVKSGDVDRGMLIEDKAITTESANPYGAFVNQAQFELGADPTAIEVTRVQLRLDQSSINVGELADVFAEDVEIDFVMNDSDHTYVVAQGTVLPGVTDPLEMNVVFESAAMDLVDYDRMLNGSFKVIVVGRANPNFQIKGATADLITNFEFAAIQ
jgi:hypothetical protein